MDWEQKTNVGRVTLTNSDPKILKPDILKILVDYTRTEVLTDLWILQTYTLAKTGAHAGYSIHWLGKDIKEKSVNYIPSNESPLMFEQLSADEFRIAEKSKLKTF